MARPALITRVVSPSGPFSVIRDFHRAKAEFTIRTAREAIRARNAHFETPIRILHAKQRTKARAALAFLRELR